MDDLEFAMSYLKTIHKISKQALKGGDCNG